MYKYGNSIFVCILFYTRYFFDNLNVYYFKIPIFYNYQLKYQSCKLFIAYDVLIIPRRVLIFAGPGPNVRRGPLKEFKNPG